MNSSESDNKSREDIKLDIMFCHGAYSLWQFLQRVFDIDIREVCSRVTKELPVLTTDTGKLAVVVIDANSTYSIVSPVESVEHKDDITFLLNCVNSVFNILKTVVMRNGERILQDYSFQLDDNCLLELVNVHDPEIVFNPDNVKLGVVKV